MCKISVWLQPRDTRYIALEDGRKLCLECLDSAIMDTSQCQPLYYDIQEFYEGLNMRVEQKVPLLLVERHALNEAMDGERHVIVYLVPSCRFIFFHTCISPHSYWFPVKNISLMLSFHPFCQGYHHMPETRGLCLSEEQTISTVRTSSDIHFFSLFMILKTKNLYSFYSNGKRELLLTSKIDRYKGGQE